MSTPSEIAAAIRDEIAAETMQRESDTRRANAAQAVFDATKITGIDRHRAWLAGYDSRDAEVAALREALEAQYAALDPLRLELDALKAHNQQMSEDAIKRPTLRALEREKVFAAIAFAHGEWYRENIVIDLLNHITDAVMQFGTPAITEERAVAVLVEQGWEKRVVRAWDSGGITSSGGKSRSGIKVFLLRARALIAPATEVTSARA